MLRGVYRWGCFMALIISNGACRTAKWKVLQNKLLLSKPMFQAVSFRRSFSWFHDFSFHISICIFHQVTSKATNGLLRTFLVTMHFFMKSLNWRGWFNALTPFEFEEVERKWEQKLLRYKCTVVTVVHLMHRIFEFFLEPKCRLDEVSFFIFAFLSGLKSLLLQLTKYQLAGTPRSV